MEKLIIGVAGVILGSILTLLKEFWSESRSRNKRASYLAVRVVGHLERFIDGCALVVQDSGYEDEQGCVRPMKQSPTIEFDSLDLDWQSLPFDLMYQIINFPSYLEDANGKISSVVEDVASPPDFNEFFEERNFQFSQLGLHANKLSNVLREKYAMPPKKYEYWNPIEHLENKNIEIKNIRVQREEYIRVQKAFNKHINPDAN